MTHAKLLFVLVVLIFFAACPFDENRQIEAMLEESEDKFHYLYDQDKFQQIYIESDDELKNKFTEQQFILYLKNRKDITGNIEVTPLVSIKDDLKDGVKRVFVTRTKFSNVELAYTETAIFREKFEWNLKGNEAKIVSYEIEKLCDKPCRLAIQTK